MTAAMTEDVHALLWDSTAACSARQRKACDAVVAIAEVLAERQPLGGGEQEFLAVLRRLEAEAPDAAREMWGTPQAYVWIRDAFDRVRTAVRSGAGPSGQVDAAAAESLAEQLERFKRFALAVAAASGLDLRFERPFESVLPLDLPNTPWSLVGDARTVTITGVANGCLLVGSDDHSDDREVRLSLRSTEPSPVTGLAIQSCPVVGYAGCRIFLKPDAFHEPGLNGATAPREAGLTFHARHAPLVEEAVKAIKRHDPETFAHLRDDISIIGLKPVGAGSYGNTTFSRMPGGFVTSPVANPLVLADDLIHETYHNRLFAIEELGRFFADESARTLACHYSPWRHDPRPVFGVFHAFYVFTRVMRFWRRVYVDLMPSKGAVDAGHIGYAVQRLLELVGQLTQARDTLRAANGLTPWGAEVFAGMEAEFARECARVGALDLPDDAPTFNMAADGSYVPQTFGETGRALTVKESLRMHRDQFDRIMACGQPRRSMEADHASG